jgi:hypothetical protein
MASGATSGGFCFICSHLFFCISLLVPYLNLYIEMILLLLEEYITRG